MSPTMDIAQYIAEFDDFLVTANAESVAEITKVMDELITTINDGTSQLPEQKRRLFEDAICKGYIKKGEKSTDSNGNEIKEDSKPTAEEERDKAMQTFRKQWKDVSTFFQKFSARLKHLDEQEKDNGGLEAYFTDEAKFKIAANITQVFGIMEQMKEVVTQLRKDGVEIEKPGVEEQKFQNVKDEEQPYCSKATPKIVKKEKKDKKKKRKESPKESIKDEPEAPFLHFKFKDASNSTSSTEPPIVNDEENSSRSDRPSTYQIFSQKQKKAEKKRRIQFEQLLQSEPLWAKNKLTLTKNGYVQRDGFGQKIRFSEFKKVAKEYPWTMFLYDYVVDCLKCGDEVTMETLDHDGCSVKCSRPGCNAVTLLGTHKKGQMFVCHYQCWHYNQIPFEEDDICRGMCPTCGEDGPFCPGYDEDVRFPRVKDESPSTSSAEPSF